MSMDRKQWAKRAARNANGEVDETRWVMLKELGLIKNQSKSCKETPLGIFKDHSALHRECTNWVRIKEKRRNQLGGY